MTNDRPLKRQGFGAPQTRVLRSAVCMTIAAVVLSTTVSAIAQPPADTGLPAGFRPSPPTPEVFTIEKPLITEDEFETWKKTGRLQFNTDVTARQLTPQVKKSLEDGVKVLVYEMTITARRNHERDGLTKLRGSIVRTIDVLALNANPAVKQILLDETIKRARDLLDGNFQVRCQAVELISSLNSTPSKPGVNPVPAVPFVGGLPVLLEVLSTPVAGGIDQPEAVRILAARGVERILKEGRQTLPLNSKLPLESAQKILAELSRPGSSWYHRSLVMALVETGISTVANAQNQQEPAVVETLARIVSDPAREFHLRARAARALGRVPMPSGVQAAPIAFALVQLARQIGEEMNAGRIAPTTGVFLYQDLYLAFSPATAGEVISDGRTKAGLRSTLNQKPINDAYGDILPIVKATFNYYAVNPKAIPIDGPKLQKLATWQAPPSMAIIPNGRPITTPMFPASAARNAAADSNRAG